MLGGYLSLLSLERANTQATKLEGATTAFSVKNQPQCELLVAGLTKYILQH